MPSKGNDRGPEGEVLTAPDPRPHLALASDAAETKGLAARDRRPGAPPPEETEPNQTIRDGGSTPRKKKSVLPRALVAMAGTILSAAALISGYLYWEFASHFEWTDDAFIASRQFAVSPQVSGY